MGPGYNHEETREEVKNQLDWANVLYAFNGATFDLPVMQRFFGYSDDDVGRWMAKLVDPLYAARGLLGFEACAKLAVILELNGLPPKCGSGSNALDLARDGRWDELAEYCVGDAKLTWELLELPEVRWVCGLVFRKGTLWSRNEEVYCYWARGSSDPAGLRYSYLRLLNILPPQNQLAEPATGTGREPNESSLATSLPATLGVRLPPAGLVGMMILVFGSFSMSCLQ
jgi:hypothetical protein